MLLNKEDKSMKMKIICFVVAVLLLMTAIPLVTSASNEITTVNYGSGYTLLDGSLDAYVKSCYSGSSWSVSESAYNSTYVVWEGKVPVTCTVLSMTDNTEGPNTAHGFNDANGGTPVALYGIGIDLEDVYPLSNEENADIITDLLKMGYIVIVADFGDLPIEEVDCMWTIQKLRGLMWGSYGVGNAYTAGLPHSKGQVFFLPEGYSVAKDVMYYDLALDSTRGAHDFIIDVFNGKIGDFLYNEYGYVKYNSVPAEYRENAETIYDVVQPNGETVELRLGMDIVYPVNRKGSEVVMIAGSGPERINNMTVRPVDTSPLLRGTTVVMYDYCFIPMVFDYGYNSLWYGLHHFMAVDTHAAAVRCARYYADTYGYSKENYSAQGHSKSSLVSCLSNPHPENLNEWNTFSDKMWYTSIGVAKDSSGNVVRENQGYLSDVYTKYKSFKRNDHYGEQPFLAYEDGTPIPSGVDIVYSSMGDGMGNSYRNMVSSDGISDMIIACGLFDQYNSWSYWDDEHYSYEDYNVNYIGLPMLEMGHVYPYMVDSYYNYDRRVAFTDILLSNLREGEDNRILYSSIVAKEVVDAAFGDGKTQSITKPYVMAKDGSTVPLDVMDKVVGEIEGRLVGDIKINPRTLSGNALASATLNLGDEIFVQFLAPVTASSVRGGAVYLLDENGNKVDGKLTPAEGGSRWYFTPGKALTAGSKYTFVVEGGKIKALDDVNKVIADGAAYSFTAE